jgi:hypothetical protein
MDPHYFGTPHQIKIRIRIKVKSWIRIRIYLKMTSQNVWNLSLFEHNTVADPEPRGSTLYREAGPDMGYVGTH